MSNAGNSSNIEIYIPILGIIALIGSFAWTALVEVTDPSVYFRAGCYASIGAGVIGLIITIFMRQSGERRGGLISSGIAIALGLGLLLLGLPVDVSGELPGG